MFLVAAVSHSLMYLVMLVVTSLTLLFTLPLLPFIGSLLSCLPCMMVLLLSSRRRRRRPSSVGLFTLNICLQPRFTGIYGRVTRSKGIDAWRPCLSSRCPSLLTHSLRRLTFTATAPNSHDGWSSLSKMGEEPGEGRKEGGRRSEKLNGR